MSFEDAGSNDQQSILSSEKKSQNTAKITSSMNNAKIFVIEDDKDKGDDGMQL